MWWAHPLWGLISSVGHWSLVGRLLQLGRLAPSWATRCSQHPGAHLECGILSSPVWKPGAWLAALTATDSSATAWALLVGVCEARSGCPGYLFSLDVSSVLPAVACLVLGPARLPSSVVMLVEKECKSKGRSRGVGPGDAEPSRLSRAADKVPHPCLPHLSLSLHRPLRHW